MHKGSEYKKNIQEPESVQRSDICSAYIHTEPVNGDDIYFITSQNTIVFNSFDSLYLFFII